MKLIASNAVFEYSRAFFLRFFLLRWSILVSPNKSYCVFFHWCLSVLVSQWSDVWGKTEKEKRGKIQTQPSILSTLLQNSFSLHFKGKIQSFRTKIKAVWEYFFCASSWALEMEAIVLCIRQKRAKSNKKLDKSGVICLVQNQISSSLSVCVQRTKKAGRKYGYGFATTATDKTHGWNDFMRTKATFFFLKTTSKDQLRSIPKQKYNSILL